MLKIYRYARSISALEQWFFDKNRLLLLGLGLIRRRYRAVGRTSFNLLTSPFQVAAKAVHGLAADET
jgi:hypothetical protein